MSRTREQERVYQLARYYKRKAEGIAVLGGQCVKCGSKNDLHFHHKDPATKSFTVSNLSGSYVSFLAELKKCELLCGPHHREKHKSKAPCGTAQRYWRGCRCDVCRDAVNIYHAAYCKKIGGRIR